MVSSIATLLFGTLALLLILVDETDNCFADIYSTAVSIQNVAPRVKQWKTIVAVAAIGVILALTVPLAEYEQFLLMIGWLFVPLLGVVVSEYAIRESRGGFDVSEFYEGAPRIRCSTLIAWMAGAAMYFSIASFFPEIGASMPAFALSALLNTSARILKK